MRAPQTDTYEERVHLSGELGSRCQKGRFPHTGDSPKLQRGITHYGTHRTCMHISTPFYWMEESVYNKKWQITVTIWSCHSNTKGFIFTSKMHWTCAYYGSTIQLQEWDKNMEARSIVTLLFRLILCSLGKGSCWGRIWGLLPPQASPPALSKASSFGEGTLSPSSPSEDCTVCVGALKGIVKEEFTFERGLWMVNLYLGRNMFSSHTSH